jgi:hypothetical protein
MLNFTDWPEALLRRRARAARADLLRMLTSSSEVRADVIPSFTSGGKRDGRTLDLAPSGAARRDRCTAVATQSSSVGTRDALEASE